MSNQKMEKRIELLFGIIIALNSFAKNKLNSMLNLPYKVIV